MRSNKRKRNFTSLAAIWKMALIGSPSQFSDGGKNKICLVRSWGGGGCTGVYRAHRLHVNCKKSIENNMGSQSKIPIFFLIYQISCFSFFKFPNVSLSVLVFLHGGLMMPLISFYHSSG